MQRVLKILKRGDDHVGCRFNLLKMVHLGFGEDRALVKRLIVGGIEVGYLRADGLYVILWRQHRSRRDAECHQHSGDSGVDA